MNDRQRQMLEAARQYYLHDRTMTRIAKDLNVSRPTVSRLLREARETGLVQIDVSPAGVSDSTIAREVSEKFGITAHVVSAEGEVGTHMSKAVSQTAAQVMASLVTPNSVVGLAWGTTMMGVIKFLPSIDALGTEVVLLNGGADPATPGIPDPGVLASAAASALGARAHYFPVPAFFDSAETREAMWRERSLRKLLELRSNASLAVFGIGAFGHTLVSRAYSDEFFSPTEARDLARAGVVGDVCTIMMRRDGTWEDIAINRRATGPTPSELKRIPSRLCVSFGRQKVAALLGCLAQGLATDLVIDEATARSIMRARLT